MKRMPHPLTPEVPLLPAALPAVPGRGVTLLPDAERQVLGGPGSLTRQLSGVYDDVTERVRVALRVPADLPARRAHPWTLLTEHESPLWPLLALKDPPPLTAAQVARLVRHLGSAHQAMPADRARQLGAPGAGAPPDATDALIATLCGGAPPTWAALLAGLLTARAHHLLLGSWGVLSAFVGAHPDLRVQGARQLRAALLADPALAARPADLARWALWSALTPLHGGADPPGTLEEAVRLARGLRSLPQRTQAHALPDPAALAAHLRAWLPDLPDADLDRHAAALHAGQAGGPGDAGVGLALLVRPGRAAYWLRVGSQVQLIVSEAGRGGAGAEWVVWSWQWFRPPGARLPGRGRG